MTDLDLILKLHRALRSARPFALTGHHRGSLKRMARAAVIEMDSALIMTETMLTETGRMTMEEIYAQEVQE